MARPGVKYSRLSKDKPDEAVFDFDSVFDYPVDDKKYDSMHSYDSVFKYRSMNGKASHLPVPTGRDAVGHDVEHVDPGTNFLLVVTSWFLTIMSYIFFGLTFPISYWFLVQNMGEFDRLVVFRLGKMIGVKGPGRFIIFPWMDRTNRIDVRGVWQDIDQFIKNNTFTPMILLHGVCS
jgi:hypothetical protein